MGNTSSRGFAGFVLVLVLVWAAGAAGLLTWTLVAADGVQDEVEVINDRVPEINEDTDAVRLAARTDDIAREIFRAAQPLDRRLREVVRVTAGIDRTATSVLRTSAAIEQEARSIGVTVGSILATAQRLAGNVRAIEDTVRSIHANAVSIDGETSSIARRLRAVLTTSRSIDRGVAGINVRTSRVIVNARRIEADTSATLEEIGPGLGDPPEDATLHGHAHSIDCRLSTLVGEAPDYCAPGAEPEPEPDEARPPSPPRAERGGDAVEQP